MRRLLLYFGEDLGRDCGHCDRCLGEPVPPLTAAHGGGIPKATAKQVDELLAAGHDALAAPRQLVRFLCGLASPATSRTRPPLTRHEWFGTLGATPFADVLAFCEGQIGRSGSDREKRK